MVLTFLLSPLFDFFQSGVSMKEGMGENDAPIGKETY